MLRVEEQVKQDPSIPETSVMARIGCEPVIDAEKSKAPFRSFYLPPFLVPAVQKLLNMEEGGDTVVMKQYCLYQLKEES